MIKKNIEIDLIKFLIMNSDQINLYNLIKKPLITLNNKKKNDFDRIYEECSKKKLYSAIELKNMKYEEKLLFKKSYQNILEKQNISINRKLKKMIDERLSIMFEDFENVENNDN